MNTVRRILSAFCLLAGSGAAEQGGHFVAVLVLGTLTLLLAWPDMEHAYGRPVASHMEPDEEDGRKCA